MDDEQLCPKCGAQCCRDEVDVGVGIIHGPWGCGGCGWSSDPEYDRSNGPSPAQLEHPDCYVDSTGGLTRISAIANNLSRFGIPRDYVEEVFKVEKPNERKADDSS